MTDRPKPSQKKQDKPGKPAPKAVTPQAKPKTVAAEASETVRREQAAPPKPAPKPQIASAPKVSPAVPPVRPASRHVAEAAEAVRREQASAGKPRVAVKAPPAALKAEPSAAPAKPKPARVVSASAKKPKRTASGPAKAKAAKPKPAKPAIAAEAKPAAKPSIPPVEIAKPKPDVNPEPVAKPEAPARAEAPAAKPTPVVALAAIKPAVPFAPQQAAALAGAAETLQQSFRAAGRGGLAVNRKLFDIAQANLQSGFDLARSLATARTPLEAAQLQFTFINERMKAFASQTEELRALSASCLEEASEPFRQLGRTRPGRKSDSST